MSASVSFDRASDDYDRTRAIGAEAMDAVVHALSDELAGRAPCLEVGVGTGRIALPLARAGVSMVGLDTSRPMLAKLLEKSAGAPPFPLVQADAVHMPWRTDAFGAAIACHVLHLIPKWGDVLTEVARIVRRRGPFMVSFGEPGSEWMRAVNERFAAAAGLPDRRAGAQNADEVAGALTTMGARVRALPTIEDVRRISVRRTIADLEAGLYSNTWSASAETRGRAARAVAQWAETELGDLDEERDDVRLIEWRVYELA